MVLTRFFGKKPDPTGTVVTVRLNDRAQPLARGERYEDPLPEMLATNGWGERLPTSSTALRRAESKFPAACRSRRRSTRIIAAISRRKRRAPAIILGM